MAKHLGRAGLVAIVAAVATVITATALVFTAAIDHASARCHAATVAADRYAWWVRSYTLYPGIPPAEAMRITRREIRLLRAMRAAGCPPSTQVITLP